MQMAFTDPRVSPSLVQIDALAAAGSCNGVAHGAESTREIGRIEIQAEFGDFELRGRSSIIGPFEVHIQDGKKALGSFRQSQPDRLWPIHGAWSVPFVMTTELGQLIPRPTDGDVLLRSASPGEFTIPPIGVWFEKRDPINLVTEGDPEGPVIAICQHAMHCMLNAGSEPGRPDFFLR